MEKVKKKSSKTKLIFFIILGLLLASTLTYFGFQYLHEKNDQEILTKATKDYEKLFKKDHTPKDNLTINDVKKIENNIKNIQNNLDKKEKLQKDLNSLEAYLNLKITISKYYKDNIMLSTTTTTDINNLKNKNKKLKKEYQELINKNIEALEAERTLIDTTIEKVNNLFTDANKNALKDNVNREAIESVKNDLNNLKQEDIKTTYTTDLDKAFELISIREEEGRKRAEEERRRLEEIRRQQEEERRKKAEEERIRQEQIAAAWVKLDVPYISQNKNGVYNGCEVASLLMGLQYKNYLRDMDIITYATNTPKSDDPEEGFVSDIFSLEPHDIVHWIAPTPLAKYGRDSSGYANVVNTTGLSIDELDRELDNGNPVVIYLTARFKTPENWIGNAPKNMHVQLLAGYNKITGEHLIVDPWTYNDGTTRWIISRNTIESVYNAVGKRSVTIR